MTTRRLLPRLIICLALLAIAAGCSPGYFWQAAAGQLEMIRLRRPVSEVIEDAATDPALRQKLTILSEALRFAHADLGLPDNGSYHDYADLHRSFAVWNVFAAAEFSLDLRTWCFPVAGCVVYRGYFHEADARAYAAGLAEQGEDVYVGGVSAYSTLGFFRDPLLSTAMKMPDWAVAGLIFHELAHQELYIGGDSSFNESFAMFVEEVGVSRWLAARHDTVGECAHRSWLERQQTLRTILAASRARLLAIYGRESSAEERRAAKAAEFSDLGVEIVRLRRVWGVGEEAGFGDAGTLNNAALGALAAYDEYVPAFRRLLQEERGQITRTYERAAELGKLPEEDRHLRLRSLGEGAPLAGAEVTRTCAPDAPG